MERYPIIGHIVTFNDLSHTHWQAKSSAQTQPPIGMRRIKPLHLFWKRIALFNMFIKNIHVSIFSINLCLENGPGKSVFENVFVKYTKYGGSNTNTNTNTWFEIWSNTNTNTNTPYLYLYLYLQIQIRIWPQPCLWLILIYRQISNIRCTKSQNLNVSRLILQLSLCNTCILKPGVK